MVSTIAEHAVRAAVAGEAVTVRRSGVGMVRGGKVGCEPGRGGGGARSARRFSRIWSVGRLNPRTGASTTIRLAWAIVSVDAVPVVNASASGPMPSAIDLAAAAVPPSPVVEGSQPG